MGWLLFLSRLGFICGIFFLLSVSLLLQDWLTQPDLKSTIITIGYFMGMIVLPLVCICYVVLLLLGKKIRSVVPRWLILSNLFFLLALIFFIFYLNDPYYHQQ